MMSEKRFIIVKSIENLYALVDKERDDKEQILILSLHKEQLGVVCDLLNEQQATIEQLKQELEEYKENWDSLVEKTSEISLRNVVLDERIGQLQQGIRIAYEKKPYPTFEDIQNEINNDIMMSEDIHKWTDGKYTLMFDEHTFFVWDNENDERMTALNVTKKLNELTEENEQLKNRLNKGL